MPGPNCVITISGDPDRSLRTEDMTVTLATQSEALPSEELSELLAKVDKDDVILAKCSKSTYFKPSDEVVKFQVRHKDLSKSDSIRTRLDATLEVVAHQSLCEAFETYMCFGTKVFVLVLVGLDGRLELNFFPGMVTN